MAAEKILRAHNRTRGIALVTRGRVASSWWERLRGLLGSAELRAGDGLLLQGEQAIHTIGMQFAMDALFLDKRNRVVRMEIAMPPQRFSPLVWQAANILELPAGTVARTHTEIGDEIALDIETET